MNFTAQTIAEFLKGEVHGDRDIKVNNISKIEDAKAGTLAFLANPKYNKFLYTTEASIVLINKDFKLEKKIAPTVIRVTDAYKSFASLLELYQQTRFNIQGIEPNSHIDRTATIGEDVYIADFAYISKNVKIGNNVKIYPHVFVGENTTIGDNTVLNSGSKIYFDCEIGKSCVVHSGAIIGSDGFGFAPQENASFKKIPQIGKVIIEDNVEIGSNTTIDRATIGATIIRKNVKLDNLIQIAHNVEIGANTVIAAQSGVSGSVKIGENCMFGGQIGFVGHITIANGVKVGAQSGISKSVKKEGTVLLGSPAVPIKDFYKTEIYSRKLPSMEKRLIQLEKEIKILKSES